MATLRYDRETVINDAEEYDEILRTRNVTFIRHYETPVFRYPTIEEISTFQLVPHIWTLGNRYYKLAEKYYGDREMWWVIAYFNKKPTEAHCDLGDTIFIPKPLHIVLETYDLEG